MALDLSVPARSSRLLSEVEVRPARVEKWIASLPLLNPAESGHKLYSTLSVYNRMELAPRLRLELLELYRPPVQHVVAELQKRYVGLPLPLPDAPKDAAERHREFQRELAYGYKHVVLAQQQLGRPAEKALALQRAMRHLTELLLASYLSYAPYPANVWREIHALYRQAGILSAAAVEVDDLLGRARRKTSVNETYKRALLLDLGDPYHLPAVLTLKMDQYLERYAELASLHGSVASVEPNCHFLIDFESDRAGVVYRSDTVLDRPERYCLLNTIELARHIHLQLTHLRNGQTPARDDLPDDFDRNSEELLLRLINAWGVNPKRTFSRKQRQNANVAVAVGLDAINYWCNGGRKLVTSAELTGPFPQDAYPGRAAVRAVQDYVYDDWNMEDESAGGMSLSKTGKPRRRIKVGDLVGIRMHGDDAWTVAAVRWVKSPNPRYVEIGAQRLAASAVPILLKAISDNNEESEFLPSLLLPPVSALNEPHTLVTPPNVFRANRIIYIDDGVRLSRAAARQLIEATGGFERIEFAIETW